jgi:hypothetical protein
MRCVMIRFRGLPRLCGPASLVLAAMVHGGSAVAADWTLAADLEQRFEADSNFRLERDSEGAVVGSTSSVGLRLGARTKRTEWNLKPGARVSAFAGEGDDSGLNRSDPRVSGGVIHRGKRFTANAAFNFVRTSVAFAQFGLAPLPEGSVVLPGGVVLLPDATLVPVDEFETISREDATLNRLNVRGGLTLSLDPRNRISASASGARTRFSDDTVELVPTTTYGTTVRLEHDLTKRTETALSLGLRHFTADDVVNTESLAFTATGGFDTNLTPRLSFGLDAGVSLIDFRQDPPGSDDNSVTFAGGLRLDWALADTRFALSATQSVEPSSLGELQSRSTAGLAVSHSINRRSELSLVSSYSRQARTGGGVGPDTDRQLFVLGPTYKINLTPDWRLSIGYRFRLSDQEDGLATSNNVFIGLSRSFDLIH